MKPPDFRETLAVGDTLVTIRTMQPEDREIEDAFVSGLSDQSRYLRFHSALKRLTMPMLERFTNVDYPNEMALIATITDGLAEREIGVARFARLQVADRAEVAVVVADEWQNKGIGSRLLVCLRRFALDAGLRHLELLVLPENQRMLSLAAKLGFSVELKHPEDRSIQLGKDVDGK